MLSTVGSTVLQNCRFFDSYCTCTCVHTAVKCWEGSYGGCSVCKIMPLCVCICRLEGGIWGLCVVGGCSVCKIMPLYVYVQVGGGGGVIWQF